MAGCETLCNNVQNIYSPNPPNPFRVMVSRWLSHPAGTYCTCQQYTSVCRNGEKGGNPSDIWCYKGIMCILRAIEQSSKMSCDTVYELQATKFRCIFNTLVEKPVTFTGRYLGHFRVRNSLCAWLSGNLISTIQTEEKQIGLECLPAGQYVTTQ